MMVGMMVRMVAMMGSTEAHILLVTFSDKEVLYVIQHFRVKPVSSQHSDSRIDCHGSADARVGGSDDMD